MKAKGVGAWVLVVGLFAACGGSAGDGAKGSSTSSGGAAASTSSAGGDATGGAGGDATGAGGAASGSGGAAMGSGGAGGSVDLAAALEAALAPCDNPWGALYKTDEDAASATIPLCKLPAAIGWSADMDVDCDGKTTPQCNSNTDPAYYPETSATDSNGDPLDAASLPFVVLPLPNADFDYASEGLSLGSVVAVVYKGQIAYGVFGDQGPKTIIGEASYAMAASLGIDPDPSTGGADDGVTYVAFTGPDAVVSPIEDHAKAVALGEALVKKLVGAN